ncbi:MAG: DUF3127 domain-containing protein [Bacteroidales bacterium]|nr:DUF3127 domain-containing protein [Bacteroidales bacterium]
MDITGRLIKILPEVRGESQRGPWVKGGFVIETEDTYPRQVAFTLFGEDRLAMVNALVMNTPVVVTFSPESREYNERWYTDLRCIRVVPFTGAAAPAPAAPATTPAAAPASVAPAAPFASAPADSEDDLPF